MTNVVQLAGQRFGRLTAIQRVAGNGNKARWLCRCICGRELTTTTKAILRKGPRAKCQCKRAIDQSKRWSRRQIDETVNALIHEIAEGGWS